MDTLFLRLPATATEAMQPVCFRQGHWQRLGSWAVDAELDQQWKSLKDLPVVLITPVGMDASIILQATPKQRREAGLNLVTLAEDQMAEDYERLHWTLHSVDDQQVLARGISKSWLQAWRDRLQASGLNIRAAIPESALFNQDHETWLWLPAGETAVYWQMELGQGAVVQRSDISALMQAQLDRQPLLSSVRLRYPQGTDLPVLPERIQPTPAPWQDWADLLKTQSSGYWLQHPQNWLVGDMANKAVSGGQSRWYWIALLAITAVLIQIGLDRYETNRLKAQASAARLEAESIYRAAFPDDRRIVNLARQFKAKQAQGSSVDPAQLLQLLAQTAPNANWQITKLEYQDAAATRVEISGPALADINTWANQLNAAGVSTQIDNARLDNGVAKAKLQLRVSSGAR
ncbi:MAG: type II secretion system protein GspL [Pseudomonadota bacterium]